MKMRTLILRTALLVFLCAGPRLRAQPASTNRVLELDGQGSYLELPPKIFNHLSEATVEGWVRWGAQSRLSDFFDFGRDRQEMFVGIRDGVLQFRINLQSPPQLYSIGFPDLIRVDEWCHLAAVSGREGMKFYCNGVLVSTNGYAGSFAAIAAGQENFFGHDNAAGRGPGLVDFQGRMDELRVWSVAQSGPEILRNMFRRLSGKEDGLFALWNFDDPAQPGRDTGPGRHHGKLVHPGSVYLT